MFGYKCVECGHIQVDAMPECPKCGSKKIEQTSEMDFLAPAFGEQNQTADQVKRVEPSVQKTATTTIERKILPEEVPDTFMAKIFQEKCLGSCIGCVWAVAC